MSTDERRLQDLFQEMLEAPESLDAGEFGAGEVGADGLEGMLFLARELQTLGQAPMPDAAPALARARERVLQSLPAAMPEAKPAPKAPFWERWRLTLVPAMAWAPAALVVVLTLVILMAVTVSASAGAMPGSPFYPVKRTTENLALHLVPQDKRAVVEDAINYHRAEEIQYARDRDIIVQVPYEGVVWGCQGHVCRIGAFMVSMTPEMAAALKPGDRVRVVIRVQPDDSLVALALAPGRTPTPASTRRVATTGPKAVGPDRVIKSLPTDTPAVVKVPPTKKPATGAKPAKRPTKKPTAARKKAPVTPKPTSRPAATPPRPRKLHTATLAPLPPPTAEPTATRPPTKTVAPTATPAPTRPPKATPKRKPNVGTATPVPRGTRVAPGTDRKRGEIQSRKVIRGKIQRVYRARGRTVWIVIGRYRVYLTRETKIVGKIAVGRQATARTYVKNGRRYASKIVVKKSSGSSGAAPTPTPGGRRVKPKPRTPTPTPERVGTRPPVRRP